MELRKLDIIKRKLTLLILFLLCAGQAVFSGCVLDSVGEGVLLYEVWTINGKAVHSMKEEDLPDYIDYPTHIRLLNYTPGTPFQGSIKFIKLGWLPIEEKKSFPSGFLFDVRGKLGDNIYISFGDLKVNEASIEGFFSFNWHGGSGYFIAINNYNL